MARPGHSRKPKDICFYDGWTHMQLFHHLVKAGPTMHGPPGPPKPKKGGG